LKLHVEHTQPQQPPSRHRGSRKDFVHIGRGMADRRQVVLRGIMQSLPGIVDALQDGDRGIGTGKQAAEDAVQRNSSTTLPVRPR
jgi:hypothetical protein